MRHCRDKQLIFEDYLSFFGNRHGDNLTVNQLNQILSLHGFQKLKYNHEIGLTKEEIIVAVNSLKLTPPTRFSLSDGNVHLSVSCSKSVLSLEEVKKDVQQIGWEECPVGSILTINPAALAVSDNSTSMPASQRKRRRTANRRNKNDERSELQSYGSVKGANKDVIELYKK